MNKSHDFSKKKFLRKRKRNDENSIEKIMKIKKNKEDRKSSEKSNLIILPKLISTHSKITGENPNSYLKHNLFLKLSRNMIESILIFLKFYELKQLITTLGNKRITKMIIPLYKE